MCSPFRILLLAALLVVSTGTARATLIYDFASPGATALDGLVQGVFPVDGLPLSVSTGTSDQAGNIILGGSDATMFVGTVNTFFGGFTGLGVNSSVASGGAEEEPLNRLEALIFDFDPSFDPRQIVVEHIGGFLGELRLFAGGVFLKDFSTVEGSNAIFLPSGISQLAITPRLGTGLSSDPIYLVSSIASVPEPATVALMCLGLGLLGFSRRRRKH